MRQARSSPEGGFPQGGPAPLVLFSRSTRGDRSLHHSRVARLCRATATKQRRVSASESLGGSPQGGACPPCAFGPAPLVPSHAAAPAVSSSPSRALLKAVIATSSMSSEGSRVVNFCVPST